MSPQHPGRTLDRGTVPQQIGQTLSRNHPADLK